MTTCRHTALTPVKVQGEPAGFVCRRCGEVLPPNWFCPDCVREVVTEPGLPDPVRTVMVPCELHRNA